MNLIATLRIRSKRLARASGGLFLLVWLGLVLAPCVSAMHVTEPGHAMVGHDCPHCPPPPCHEAEPEDCTYPESLDVPRAGESDHFELAFLSSFAPETGLPETMPEAFDFVAFHKCRDGPRLHLLNVQFDE